VIQNFLSDLKGSFSGIKVLSDAWIRLDYFLYFVWQSEKTLCKLRNDTNCFSWSENFFIWL